VSFWCCSVKHVTFYDDDVRFWQAWMSRSAAGERSMIAGNQQPTIGGGHMTIKGRHFLVVCCENKVIFLDLVSMRARDVPRTIFDSKSPLCVAFLPRSGVVEGPIAAFGCSDGVIRVLSMTLWQLVRRYISGHKGPVSCLLTFQASSGEIMLVSGGNDGTLSLWNIDGPQATKELTPKLSVKAHKEGVYALELARVQEGPPQLISIGADKTLAIWDTQFFKELRRIKPVSKLACRSVASWCHPRVPNLDLLVCVKDPHIW
jgi:WD40 repeat protein